MDDKSLRKLLAEQVRIDSLARVPEDIQRLVQSPSALEQAYASTIANQVSAIAMQAAKFDVASSLICEEHTAAWFAVSRFAEQFQPNFVVRTVEGLSIVTSKDIAQSAADEAAKMEAAIGRELRELAQACYSVKSIINDFANAFTSLPIQSITDLISVLSNHADNELLYGYREEAYGNEESDEYSVILPSRFKKNNGHDEDIIHHPTHKELKALSFTPLRLIRLLSKAPEDLHKLNSREFEELIAELAFASGFQQVELTKATRDKGVDVKAVTIIEGIDIHTVFSCKHPKSRKSTGERDVRELLGVFSDSRVKANKGVLCTSAGLTPDAWKCIKANQIKVYGKERSHIIDWILSAAKKL